MPRVYGFFTVWRFRVLAFWVSDSSLSPGPEFVLSWVQAGIGLQWGGSAMSSGLCGFLEVAKRTHLSA